MAQSKKDTEPTLSDAEILEALQPAQKQLRALDHIAKTVDVYWQVKSSIQALEKRHNDLKKSAEAEQAKLDAVKKNVNDEIQRLNASIDQKREQLTAGLKKELNDLSSQLEYLKGQVEANKSELEKAREHLDTRMNEINGAILEREQIAKDIISGLEQKITAKQADLDKVQRDFTSFMKRHGMAEPTP